ncbi:undecaprenyldiphospho-muramoylpentapeptide beta-N-acetylglucosaminyltransferase [Pantoea sp. Nvir]|uniref:undecaprenyldiphospho-muramoylpentapeptide beta-N-acetylglucosaminyltransferase n=1 Tax=Pantoea sp. Nvir TaxID=2576760 RepID=UPI00135BC550|nr:undecaprenyldiphospho-muramoylpentapeptide beta-N-acetylglucosaminyltransferase [Pantoea sp. Nvir]MXP66851.1 undecaprenyldiphospho-muramoylpentapeptide beta-N-acetylglucosaminyltransferase [Pantoea sp. Nvir]CAJ0991262.1 UDP-N-acetylglucosamine--N-acetylmuramyl-(pentapeptide) pyrophosphoryl-undecaprenol N-acetylglucosamine transferase [Pantoea sp. Nvir]
MSGKRLMVMAGGTGGHVFPGLTVAHHLMEQGWQVRWLGTIDRMEADLVPKHAIDIEFIHINGLRDKGLKALLLASMQIFNALYQARTIVRAWKPDVVLGMGGYVSGPGCLAAWSCGVPVVLHEQNRIAGFTNKCLENIASKVLQAFPGAFPYADVVGNPVRPNVLRLLPPDQRFANRSGPIRVLVVGGSQGAHVLNQTLPQVAAALQDSIILWHQTGNGARLDVLKSYQKVGQPQHKVTEFISDMAAAYAWADIVVCRSGALTVSEIAAAGLPAIFVPFQHKDRQQYWNALPLEKAGAAKIFEQSQFTADAISKTLSRWDRSILFNMAVKARQEAILDATERVALEVARVAK